MPAKPLKLRRIGPNPPRRGRIPDVVNQTLSSTDYIWLASEHWEDDDAIFASSVCHTFTGHLDGNIPWQNRVNRATPKRHGSWVLSRDGSKIGFTRLISISNKFEQFFLNLSEPAKDSQQRWSKHCEPLALLISSIFILSDTGQIRISSRAKDDIRQLGDAGFGDTQVVLSPRMFSSFGSGTGLQETCILNLSRNAWLEGDLGKVSTASLRYLELRKKKGASCC